VPKVPISRTRCNIWWFDRLLNYGNDKMRRTKLISKVKTKYFPRVRIYCITVFVNTLHSYACICESLIFSFLHGTWGIWGARGSEAYHSCSYLIVNFTLFTPKWIRCTFALQDFLTFKRCMYYSYITLWQLAIMSRMIIKKKRKRRNYLKFIWRQRISHIINFFVNR